MEAAGLRKISPPSRILQAVRECDGLPQMRRWQNCYDVRILIKRSDESCGGMAHQRSGLLPDKVVSLPRKFVSRCKINMNQKTEHMSNLLERRLQLLETDSGLRLLRTGLRGIEREAMRVDQNGHLALTPHPAELGAALAHSSITTDFAEPLLELITPPEHGSADALERLDVIHRFVYAHLGGELLWNQSMPCRLPEDADIPIAWYGTSSEAMVKHVYRQGLAVRYGRTMQCIAGIHYNFSLNDALWETLRASDGEGAGADAYRSAGYIGMIRNFDRCSWLLVYLFGASPACDSSFLRQKNHGLASLSPDTLYAPYATSLRMSDLGYKNSAQAAVDKAYNSLEAYIAGVVDAMETPYPAYEEIGTHRDGKRIQLNTNLLQIENEYYSSVRPKRVPRRGQTMLDALRADGIQYVELRCLDIDPFEPLGIGEDTLRFLDVFAHYCVLRASSPRTQSETAKNVENFSRVAREGRRPGLALHDGDGMKSLAQWGQQLIDEMRPVARLLDTGLDQPLYLRSLEKQQEKLLNPDAAPSARVLESIKRSGGSFAGFSLEKSAEHASGFRARPPSAEEEHRFSTLALESIRMQQEMERRGSRADPNAMVHSSMSR